MAKKNPELESLRKQVLARQRAAGKKVSRLKSQGADIAGTRNDPRKSAATVGRLNSRQLRSQLSKLDKFMDRKTQFHADANGKLLSPTAWARYKKAEAQINRIKKKSFDPIKKIKAPGAGGVTIEQRHKIVTPDRPRAGNPAVNPFTFVNRKSTSITSAKALKQLTKDLEKKLRTDFLGKELKNDRRAANDMLRTLNKADWIDELDKMSDFHFNILWNWTRFATDISAPYLIAQHSLRDKGWRSDIFDENLESAKGLLSDVKKIKFRR